MTNFTQNFVLRILPLLALAFAAIASAASATPNPFRLTGSPASGRDNHSATLLPNGKVLIVGGNGDAAVPLATAELYDPATGKWAPTGSMAHARYYYHAAVLLPNGKVLVAGGSDSGPTATAELYDPATGTWAPTGSMQQARSYHTLTVLADGRVLAAAGFKSNGSVGAIATAEIYDPATEQWTPTSPLNEARLGHTATLLPDGRVLVAGGGGGGSSPDPLASAELYDPVSGTWATTGSLAAPLTDHTATLLQNGTVLVAGGLANYWLANATQIYDPATGSWTASGNVVTGRRYHTATLLPSGDVLLAGGQENLNSTLAEIYHPATGTCTAVGNLADGERSKHTATLLPNGRVLIAGGRGYPFTAKTAELFDPADGQWSATGSVSEARLMHMAIRLADGRVLIAGGQDSHSFLATAELYDPATRSWTQTGSMAKARWLSPPVLLADGRVLFPAGEDDHGKLNSAELYEPATGTWKTTGSLAAARGGHTATLLADGRVLVAGGVGMTSAELYDPATEQWTPTGDLTTARNNHVAVLLPNGQVLVVGGSAEGGAELYDPVLGTWTATGRPAFSIYGWRTPSAFLLPTGKVLYFGGGTDTILNNAELYDPATGTWTTVTGANRSSNYFVATQLANGQVLLAGGNTNDTATTAEIYDPASGAWRATGNLVGEHMYYTLTPLLDGTVLAASGIAYHQGFTATAELYDPGLGFPEAARPRITSVSSPLRIGSPLALTGSGLLGLSGGSGGNGLESATNFPLVQVRSVSNGQTIFVLPAATSVRSAAAYVSQPLSDLFPGMVEITVIANGIPSPSVVVPLEAAVPSVTTGAATNPSISGVTLNSRVSAMGALTQVRFEYSTAASFLQKVISATVALPPAAVNAPVSQTIAGLAAHTTYYYRAVATNSAGTVVGEIASYTTGNTTPAAPDGTATATTGAAQTITLDFPATDPDGDAVTLLHADGDAHLTVTSVTGRKVSFTIAAHFAGAATITYQVSDGGRSATGQITVTVPDEAPVITLTGANPLVLGHDVPFVEPGAAALDAVDGALALTTTGSVDPAIAGDYTITYSATDSAAQTVTATRTVTVSPAAAPVAAPDRYFTADTRKTPLVLHVLDNDTAYVPSSLTIVSVTAPRLGTAAIAGDGRTITYTPRVLFASFATSDTFTYTIRDNFGVTAAAQVTVGNSARQLKGVYDALLSDGAVTVGYARLALTTTGNWTGVLQLGTVSKPILGRFDLENSSRLAVGGTLLTLRLADTGIAVTLGAGVSGTLTRASFDATHRTSKAGRYTCLLPAPASAPDTVPAGAGYAIMVVSPSGLATLSGRGGDGALWSASGFLKEENQDITMALYSIIRYLPGPAGTLSGRITFRDLVGVSDCDGPLAWFKPPQTGTAPYAGGFSVTVPSLGSRYAAPARKQALVFSNHTLGAGSLTMAGADLVSPINGTIAVRSNNAVSETSTPGHHLSLGISAGSGLFSGTITGHFQMGAQTRTAPGILRGVLFQKQNLGQGHFIGPAHSGELLLLPQ